MVGCGTSTYTDPRRFRASLTGMEVGLVLTGGQAFKAQVAWADLPRLRLLSVEERAPRVAFMSLITDKTFFSLPLRGERSSVWNGARVQPGEIVLHPPGERFHQCCAGGARWGMIAIRPVDLATYGIALLGEAITLPRSSAILQPRKGVAADILRLHGQACRLARRRPDLLAHREVARALEQDLLVALVNALADCRPLAVDKRRERHARIMARFEDLLSGQRGGQLSTSELCRAMDVPERTLRMCSLAFVGRSPASYARLRRLNLVRAALTRSEPGTASVSAIAREHGFSEAGRFAAAYRALFDETPSTTLRHGQADLCLKFAESA